MSKSSDIESLVHRWANGESPRGLGHHLLASGLQFAAWGYGAVMNARNTAYNVGLKSSYKVPAKVISIGNLSAGGTGKTPLVIMTAKILSDAGHRVAVVSRGFRRQDASKSVIVSLGKGPIVPLTQSGDEPRMLAKSLPGVGVAVGADRVDAAKLICREFGAEIIVLDDGFQHRRLKRELDIVTWDAMRPFKSQRLLPRGILREGISSLKRANAVIITRQNLTDCPPKNIIASFLKVNPKLEIFLADAIPGRMTALSPAFEADMDFNTLKTRKIGAVCGIGNPQSFRTMLERGGLNIIGLESFTDHYRPSVEEMKSVEEQFINLQADCILTTEKDMQNLPSEWEPSIPVYSTGLRTIIRGGAEKYSNFVKNALDLKED